MWERTWKNYTNSQINYETKTYSPFALPIRPPDFASSGGCGLSRGGAPRKRRSATCICSHRSSTCWGRIGGRIVDVSSSVSPQKKHQQKGSNIKVKIDEHGTFKDEFLSTFTKMLIRKNNQHILKQPSHWTLPTLEVHEVPHLWSISCLNNSTDSAWKKSDSAFRISSTSAFQWAFFRSCGSSTPLDWRVLIHS